MKLVGWGICEGREKSERTKGKREACNAKGGLRLEVRYTYIHIYIILFEGLASGQIQIHVREVEESVH